MATTTDPNNSPSTTDPELDAIERASRAKREVIAALILALNARRARGDSTDDLAEQIDLEQLALAGFTRALENRRKELRMFGRRS